MTERSKSSLLQAFTSLAPGREAPCRQRRSTQIAALVAAALFMENLDGAIIVTALPQMAQSFGTDPVSLNIGVTVYMLTLAFSFRSAAGWQIDSALGACLPPPSRFSPAPQCCAGSAKSNGAL